MGAGDQGSTVAVSEHDLDGITTADHVLDLGPGGGQRVWVWVRMLPDRAPGGATLPGGEAQRVKLAKELAKRSTGQTL